MQGESMRILTLSIVAILIAGPMAWAQQDPNDPGLPDSIIIQAADVDSGSMSTTMRIWIVTDDSVAFYNMPIAWRAPQGGINPNPGTTYFPPLTYWDIAFDSAVTSNNFIRMIGIFDADSGANPPLLTNEQRVNVINARFNISSNPCSQMVLLDSIYDPVNGSLMFGLADGITEFKPIFMPDSFYVYGTGINDKPDRPDQFELLQNYPNPFNAQTTISYCLPEAGPVTLSIYNIMGQKVATLMDGTQDTGEHQTIWNAGTVPSGIYFYRLTTVNVTQIKRMILIR
jgi:hypothetical protein